MGNVVTPLPRWSRKERGFFELAGGTPVIVGASLAGRSSLWSIAPLLGLRRVRRAGKLDPGRPIPRGMIAVGCAADHGELAALSERRLGRGGDGRLGLGAEGYRLSICPEGVRLVAADPSGAFYGVGSLLQLAEGHRRLAAATIADEPLLPIRGYHSGVRSEEDGPALERLITTVLPRHRANWLLLGIGYRLRSRSHPEVREETSLSPAWCRRLARLGREHGIRVVPGINCYGHQTSASGLPGALLRAYPEFNEGAGLTEVPPVGHNWCPTDRRVYRVIFDLLDEAIEAFETDTVHVGMDEVFEFGLCRRCRGRSPAELFAHAVNSLHGHVVGRRGKKMVIWGDRLVDGLKTPYNQFNGSRLGTHPARRLIPKDVLLCDWHYHLHGEYPSVDQFERAGLDYVICPWWKHDAVRAFARYAGRHGGRHLQGLIQTNWHGAGRAVRGLLRFRNRRPRPACTGERRIGRQIEGAAATFMTGMRWAWGGRV